MEIEEAIEILEYEEWCNEEAERIVNVGNC